MQNFALARGEQFVAVFDRAFLHLAHVVLHQHLADRGAEERLAFADGSDRGDQIVLGGILQQVGAGAGLKRLEHVALVGVHAQENDGGLRQLGGDLPRGFDAVQDRHGDVHHDDVRLMQFSASATASRPSEASAMTVKSGLAFEQQTQALAHDGVVVGEHNADRLHASLTWLGWRAAAGSATRQRSVPCPGRNRP